MKKIKIAFLGSDGSGKTSLIQYAQKKLQNEGKNVRIFFMGWRDLQNPVLRAFSKIYLKKKEKCKKTKEEKLARFRERSWFFYIFYYAELWTRYFKILFSGKEIIFMDRYFYDELVFSSGSKFRFFNLLTPKPDLCIILKCPIKIIEKRGVYIKKEIFENFYNHLNLAKNFCRVVEIDSSGDIEKTYLKIKPYLIDILR